MILLLDLLDSAIISGVGCLVGLVYCPRREIVLPPEGFSTRESIIQNLPSSTKFVQKQRVQEPEIQLWRRIDSHNVQVQHPGPTSLRNRRTGTRGKYTGSVRKMATADVSFSAMCPAT